MQHTLGQRAHEPARLVVVFPKTISASEVLQWTICQMEDGAQKVTIRQANVDTPMSDREKAWL
jgi:hypothetical protein